MAEFIITDPSGKEFVVTAPEGVSQEQVLEFAKSQFAEPASMTKTAKPKPAPFRGVSEFQLDPKNPQQSVTDYFNRVEETSPGVKGAAPVGLPMALSMGGGIAGGMVGGPPGAVAGRAGGAALGEYANQQFGITEESIGQIAFAGAASLVGDTLPGLVNAVKRTIAPMLPGAGTVLRRLGIAKAEALPGSLRPPRPSDQLYDEVRQLNPSMDISPVKQIAAGLQAEENKLLSKNASSLTAKTKSLIDDLAGAPTQTNFDGIWATMKGINKQIGEAAAKGGAELGALKQLKRAFADSVEAAANSNTISREAALRLRRANTSFKREISAETVDEIVAKNFGRALEGTEEWSSSAAQAHRQLTDAVRKDKYLKDAFAPGGLERVLDTFDEIRKLPVRGAPSGADAGSKNILKRSVIGGGLGELAGRSMGLPPGLGGVAGTIAGVAGTDLLAEAVKTPRGAKMLVDMLKAPGGYTAPKAAALATFLRAQTAETKQFEENFTAAMKSKDLPINEKIQAAMERDTMKRDLAASVEALRN